VPGRATAFGHEFEVWDEVRLLWIVILAGALGSLVHALRSVYWYVGNRSLVWSWTGKYILMPFSGSALAVVFYFVIRGGFFSPQAGFSQTSPFGFAALSAMVGLFSEQAVLKLKQVAETVLSRPEKGADSQPQQATTK
jgi:phosphatidylglycerophosphate synthase